MADERGTQKSNSHRPQRASAESAARLNGLLRDLETLHDYLRERGQHTYDLAQRFLANSQRDSSARAYDERQATMLGYQRYIWHEIAGRVQQLLVVYRDEESQAQEPAEAEDERS